MPLPRITSLLIAAALLVPAVAVADVDRFAAVDAAWIKLNGRNDSRAHLVIGGVLDSGGGRTGTYHTVTDPRDLTAQCHRLATIVLSKPGRFYLDVEFERTGTSGGTLLGCTLVRTP